MNILKLFLYNFKLYIEQKKIRKTLNKSSYISKKFIHQYFHH